MVDMVTIGAGGGSIARLSDGALTVGPRAPGAMPGPACYGSGGERADGDRCASRAGPSAGVVAGRPHAARCRRWRSSAIRTRVAEPLGLSLHEAARGILAIVDNNMVGAIRVVSVERGHDPRDFTLVAFGGAGPLHGCALAELLGIARVLVPPAPGVLCAEGLLAADLKAEFSRTLPRPDEWDAADGRCSPRWRPRRCAWLDAERVAAGRRGRSRASRCCATTARAASWRSPGPTTRERGEGGIRRRRIRRCTASRWRPRWSW